MTKDNRISRIRQSFAAGIYSKRIATEVLRDYYHAVNEDAIELSTKAGTTAGMHRAAMQRVMKQIGIKIK